MATPLTGKVTNIIDQYTVALNIGKDNGVVKGMKFEILGPTVTINDPDTHEKLGELSFVKARVEVTQVYNKFCVAESYETIIETPLPFPTFYVSRTVTKKLPVDPVHVEVEKRVKVGDLVRQILEEPKSP